MFLKKYKITYKLYNFFKKNELSHNLPFYEKYGLKKKYYSSVSSLDFQGVDSPLNLLDKNNSREELPKHSEFNLVDERFKESLLSWSDNGYAILDNFFENDEIDSFNKEIDDLLDSKKAKFNAANKIMFAIHSSEKLKNAGNNEQIMRILNLLMGKKISLFQSINFIEGSQQRTHSDSIHMTTFPYGNLIAIWVALEDIDENCGPLHYYPGSHKLPYIMNDDYENVGTKYKLGNKSYSAYEDQVEKVLSETDLHKKTFTAKKGDVLIWHANLLHGGNKVIEEGSTRKSMVFHYYTDDAICYHEITQRPTLKPKKILA
ncbi:MAG TPA: phytanoyl-CoA dioxygenase [Crocinitomicaceae bacterium]|nr:phytanoyl-CoA dioxygenase [Crocinitomicaceae bacterium]